MRVVVVDDNECTARSIQSLTQRFLSERDLDGHVKVFSSGIEFLRDYHGDADLVLLDILMPGLDGMDTARQLRAVDPLVPLIFITSSVQYAVAGYQVDALSYLVKPVSWPDLEHQLQRALARMSRDPEPIVSIGTKSQVQRVRTSELVYIETRKHKSTLYTLTQALEVTSSMKALCAKLPADRFQRINAGLVVNLFYVSSVGATTCTLTTGTELPVSRSRRRDLLEALTTTDIYL